MATIAPPSVIDLEKQYLLQNYARYPLVLHRGKGCYVYDTSGKRYLDLIAGIGVNALGLLASAPYQSDSRTGRPACFIRRISTITNIRARSPNESPAPAASTAMFFCNSGAESIEGALKMARVPRPQNQPRQNRSHLAAKIRSTAAPSARSPSPARRNTAAISSRCCPASHFVPRNDIAALEQVVSDRTAGIVLELVQGEGGIYPLSAEYVRKARELADRHNALLIFDEIQCGVGRPGTYFAYQISNRW